MRIITGSAKGTKLFTLEGEATRPTSERTKEAIFSMIQFDIEGRAVLDLFAGSGQLGLEALSRGAESAMFIDASRDAMEIVKKNAEKTKTADRCRYLVSDYRNYIRKAAGRDKFDIVFIDPPYADGSCAEALSRLWRAELLKNRALVICESADGNIFENDKEGAAEHFNVLKENGYGKAHITLLEAKEKTE